MSFEELDELTPSMFKALLNRRSTRFKHECYQHGITASMVANANRAENSRTWSPMDFIGKGAKDDSQEVADIKQAIKSIFLRLDLDASHETCKEIRAGRIAALKENGWADAEEIFDSVFPHLKD